MKNTKQAGFSVFGSIIIIALLIILIGGGIFAYNLIKDKKSSLTAENAKQAASEQLNKTKEDISKAASNAVNNAVKDATNTAVDSATGKITESLNSLKK